MIDQETKSPVDGFSGFLSLCTTHRKDYLLRVISSFNTFAPSALAAISTVAKPKAPAAAVTKTVWLEL